MARRQLQLLVLGCFAAIVVGDAPVAAPAVARATPPNLEASATAPDPIEREVLERLDRHAPRSGLTEAERVDLARAIVEEARHHDIDPALVLAVIHVESRYDAFAVSNKDAMGLMQILPSTGEWLAPRVGVPWYGPQTLFDPVANVRLGVAYLRQLTDRYRGDMETALAAYNWGPGAIDRFLARGRPLPQEYANLVLDAYGPSI